MSSTVFKFRFRVIYSYPDIFVSIVEKAGKSIADDPRGLAQLYEFGIVVCMNKRNNLNWVMKLVNFFSRKLVFSKHLNEFVN